MHRFPAHRVNLRWWFALVAAVAWISFGGHWVELIYLNGLRPRIATRSDGVLALVRVCAWLAGGAILCIGAVTTFSLLIGGVLPQATSIVRAALFGGPLFVAIELIAHTALGLRGRDSFWNGRG